MSSQLDLIFTNELEMVSDVQHMAPLGRSDQQMLKLNFNCYADYTGTHQRFNYNRGDNEDARQELQEVPITVKCSVQQMWDTIKDRVIGLRNDNCLLSILEVGSGRQTIPMTKSWILLERSSGVIGSGWLDSMVLKGGVHGNHIIGLETG